MTVIPVINKGLCNGFFVDICRVFIMIYYFLRSGDMIGISLAFER